MKVFAWLLAVVGLICTAASGALLVKNMWDLRILYEVAMANKSQASVVNPATMVLIGAGLAFAGGLLLGIGLGMPKKTRGSVREEAVEEYKQNLLGEATKGRPEAQPTRRVEQA